MYTDMLIHIQLISTSHGIGTHGRIVSFPWGEYTSHKYASSLKRLILYTVLLFNQEPVTPGQAKAVYQ